MAQLGALISFTAGTPAVANDVNYNFNLIRTFINSANFGVDNINSTLASRSGSPILTINQVSEPFSPLYIINSQNKSGIQIDQQVSLDANHGGILINDTATQANASTAGLLMHLSNASTNSAILIKHGGAGGTETFKLTKSALSLFAAGVELSEARLKLPVRDTAQQNAVTQEGSILYNSDTQEVNVRKAGAWSSIGSPAGVVQMYAGSSAPTGWLICNGAVVSQTTYPELYAAIGATFNTGGEGAGNFRLPDMRGAFVRGAGTTQVPAFSGAYNGGSVGTYSAENLGPHTHTIPVFVTSSNTGPITGQSSAYTNYNSGSSPFNSANVNSYDANFSRIIGANSCNNTQNGNTNTTNYTTGSAGAAGNLKPASISLHYIIKH